MGLLIDGVWRDQWYDTQATGGRFVRPRTTFRNWVTRDGASGPSGIAGFAAAPHRYHLYVSLACPWAHRTLIMRALKGLEDLVSISVVHWRMLDHGWTFDDGPGVIADPIQGAGYLYQVYLAADRSYTGRVTTPVLWDKLTGDDRQQRVRGNRPHVQRRLRRSGRASRRLLPRRPARAKSMR